MNLIFMGTPAFAIPSFEALVKSKHKLITVVTQTDKPVGRKREPCAPPVKDAAIRFGIPIIQPEKVNDKSVVDQLAKLGPDIIVTVAFGQKISPKILNLPRYKCINIHASLLPKYRGAAPINWAIIRGDEETGVTSMVMREEMDAGEVILQKSIRIEPNETAGNLGNRLSALGAELLIETLDQFDRGTIQYTQQDENLVTYAPKLKKKDGLIDWNRNTKEIHDFVRGMNPWPAAYATLVNGSKKERVIILETEKDILHTINRIKRAGTVIDVSDYGIKIATKDGCIWVTEIKPEGKRKMNAAAFSRGHDIKTGSLFG
ncbi:MAG: methionyl-tRNA formyltransferase [Candidatus Scalindua sp.]|nr:methionyl-tRNA formyltransferase [Candidatus Scalindua sp.]